MLSHNHAERENMKNDSAERVEQYRRRYENQKSIFTGERLTGQDLADWNKENSKERIND